MFSEVRELGGKAKQGKQTIEIGKKVEEESRREKMQIRRREEVRGNCRHNP